MLRRTLAHMIQRMLKGWHIIIWVFRSSSMVERCWTIAKNNVLLTLRSYKITLLFSWLLVPFFSETCPWPKSVHNITLKLFNFANISVEPGPLVTSYQTKISTNLFPLFCKMCCLTFSCIHLVTTYFATASFNDKNEVVEVILLDFTEAFDSCNSSKTHFWDI